MSTSIAQLPAYKPTKTSRSKAVVNRTIFGTTLDSHDKCRELLANDGAILEAQALYAARYKKHRTPTPHTQHLNNSAWGIKDFSQSEIGEQFVRNYSQLSHHSDLSGDTQVRAKSAKSSEGSLQLNESSNKRAATALGFNPPVKSNIKSRRRPKTSISVKSSESMESQRSSKSRKSKQGTKQNFYLPPGARNYMRIASLKITETGAKDLINAKPINKIGFADTLQYNYDDIKPREKPEVYKNHGHVLQLGQKFAGDTTNKSDAGPGAYYKLTPRERSFNERYRDSLSGSVSGFSDSFREDVAMKHRRTFESKERLNKSLQKEKSPTSSSKSKTKKEVEIPLNIKHKFGEDDIDSLLSDRKNEIQSILSQEGTTLKHSGILPPRSRIHELNHPISPSVKYYSNFGQSLKGDKFEGGLHLYIK